MESFIHMMKICLRMGSLNTVMALFSGMSMSAVSRLKATWTKISGNAMKSYRVVEELFSTEFNYRAYRKYEESAQPPFVPFIGMHLRDLVFQNDALPTFISATSSHVFAVENYENKRNTYHSTSPGALDKIDEEEVDASPPASPSPSPLMAYESPPRAPLRRSSLCAVLPSQQPTDAARLSVLSTMSSSSQESSVTSTSTLAGSPCQQQAISRIVDRHRNSVTSSLQLSPMQLLQQQAATPERPLPMPPLSAVCSESIAPEVLLLPPNKLLNFHKLRLIAGHINKVLQWRSRTRFDNIDNCGRRRKVRTLSLTPRPLKESEGISNVRPLMARRVTADSYYEVIEKERMDKFLNHLGNLEPLSEQHLYKFSLHIEPR